MCRGVVMDAVEKSPPAPLYKRGEKTTRRTNEGFPPFIKGGQGGFSNANISTGANHAP